VYVCACAHLSICNMPEHLQYIRHLSPDSEFGSSPHSKILTKLFEYMIHVYV